MENTFLWLLLITGSAVACICIYLSVVDPSSIITITSSLLSEASYDSPNNAIVFHSTHPARYLLVPPWQIPPRGSTGVSFYFREEKDIRSNDFAIPLMDEQKARLEFIQMKFNQSLCATAETTTTAACEDFIIRRCVSSTLQSWYTAADFKTSVSGRIMSSPHQQVDITTKSSKSIKQMDIGIIVCDSKTANDPAKLRKFFHALGIAIRLFLKSGMRHRDSKMAFRVILIRAKPKTMTTKTTKKSTTLMSSSKLQALVSNEFVKIPNWTLVSNITIDSANCQTPQQPLSLLYSAACHRKDCVLSVVDLHTTVKLPFFTNALAFVAPRTSAYFPIPRSTVSPASAALVTHFTELHANTTPHAFASAHTSAWSTHSYQHHAVAGPDLLALIQLLDAAQTTDWFAEERRLFDLYHRILNTVRMKDSALLMEWNPKSCRPDNIECLEMEASIHGSQLGMYLRLITLQNLPSYSSIVTAKQRAGEMKLGKKE